VSKQTATPTLADLESAAKSAQRARAAAETARDEAKAAVATAEEALDGLLAGLRAGDDSITTEDVANARGEIERRELLLQGAEAKLSEARWDEAHKVASYSAELIVSGSASRAELDAAVRKAGTDVAKALQRLIAATRARADAIQTAKTSASAAGLASADPTSPTRLERGQLVIHGEPVEEVSVIDAVEEALADALVAADVNLRVEK